MKRTLIVLLVIFLSALVLAACAPVESKQADGTVWQSEEVLYEYKRVKTGTVKVGDVNVPIYGNRWKAVDTAELTGTDAEPVYPSYFDCAKTQPVDPELGDQYCDQLVRYYLIFGDQRVEIDQGMWSSHTPEKVYQVQTTLFGLVIVPGK